MRITQEGLNLIRKWETLRLEAYQCPAQIGTDQWTIGYGHTRTAHKGQKITDVDAETLLTSDVIPVSAALRRLVKVPLNENQFSALVALVFNIGVGNFTKSTMLKKLNLGLIDAAAQEFPRWNKARVKGRLKVLRGLTSRRKEEQKLFLKAE